MRSRSLPNNCSTLGALAKWLELKNTSRSNSSSSKKRYHHEPSSIGNGGNTRTTKRVSFAKILERVKEEISRESLTIPKIP
jgi:hypothetical protein